MSDATSRQLIGHMVYVHAGQNEPSNAGGKILEIFWRPGMAKNRRVIRFKWMSSGIGVKSEKAGWGNEKKIDWAQVEPMGRQSTAKLVRDDDESAFPEGKEKFKIHLERERDSTIIRKAKMLRLQRRGTLACDVCEFDFSQQFGVHGVGFIEAHHTRHVSTLDGSEKTKISDLALVCSNCHRMLHRGPRRLSIADLRKMRGRAGSDVNLRASGGVGKAQ